MQNYRGLTDKELLEKLKSIPHGSLQGPTRKLYEKKIYEFETRRCRRGGGDDPDHDSSPPPYGGAARAWQPVPERFRAPPTLMEEEQRLEHPHWGQEEAGGAPLPREPLRPRPPRRSPPPSHRGPPPPPAPAAAPAPGPGAPRGPPGAAAPRGVGGAPPERPPSRGGDPPIETPIDTNGSPIDTNGTPHRHQWNPP